MKNERIVTPSDPHDAEDRAVSQEGMERGQKARFVRQIRAKLGLSQTEFAARFRVPVGTLRDWEQARSTAPDFAFAYMRVIALYPDIVAQAIGLVFKDNGDNLMTTNVEIWSLCDVKLGSSADGSDDTIMVRISCPECTPEKATEIVRKRMESHHEKNKKHSRHSNKPSVEGVVILDANGKIVARSTSWDFL